MGSQRTFGYWEDKKRQLEKRTLLETRGKCLQTKELKRVPLQPRSIASTRTLYRKFEHGMKQLFRHREWMDAYSSGISTKNIRRISAQAMDFIFYIFLKVGQ